MTIRPSRLFDAAVLVCLGVGCWQLFATDARPVRADQAARMIGAGDTLRIPNRQWTSGRRHAVLAIDTTCAACESNASFYADLSRRAAHDKGRDVIVLSREDEALVKSWLASKNIAPAVVFKEKTFENMGNTIIQTPMD